MNPGQSVKDRAALFIIQDAVRARHPAARRHGGGRHRRQHRHRPDRDRQCAGLPHRHRHPRDAEPGEEGRAAPARRPSCRGAGRALQEPQQLRALFASGWPKALAKTEPNGAIWANQWDNTANRRAHIETTTEEIWADTDGKVDGFVSAVGSGGTLGGVSDGLKAKRKDIQIALADVPGASLYSYFTTGVLKAEGSSITEGIGTGPHHQEHRRRRGRSRLPDPGRGIGADLLPAAAGGGPVHGRLDRRQRRRRHPARQGDGPGPHHRHPALRLRHALPVEAVRPGVPASRRTCRCQDGSASRRRCRRCSSIPTRVRCCDRNGRQRGHPGACRRDPACRLLRRSWMADPGHTGLRRCRLARDDKP